MLRRMGAISRVGPLQVLLLPDVVAYQGLAELGVSSREVLMLQIAPSRPQEREPGVEQHTTSSVTVLEPTLVHYRLPETLPECLISKELWRKHHTLRARGTAQIPEELKFAVQKLEEWCTQFIQVQLSGAFNKRNHQLLYQRH